VGTVEPGSLDTPTDVTGNRASDDRRGNGDRRSAAAVTGTVESAPESPDGTGRSVYRFRDLDARERWVAAAFCMGLLLAPIAAFAIFIGEWTPASDPSLMAIRALDVGTSRTPLIGLPSSSRIYSGEWPAHHPGPLHLYLMAVPIRLFGGAAGMLLVSVLITGAALVASAWAVFRQLGRAAGMLAAVLLSAIAFTTGAGSLVNPVSSSIAGYPLLLSAVLLWCVACGDIKLLPITAAAVTFTAQQHLSVGISIAMITAGSLALLAVTAWREGWWRDADTWHTLKRQAVVAGVVSVVLWTPVLVQQIVDDTGNLSQIVAYARSGDSEKLGAESGVWQVVHALGFPPLLGRTELLGRTALDGVALFAEPSTTQWLTAGGVLALAGWLGWRRRSTHRRRAMLSAMVGVVAVAGFLNGSSIPHGLEQGRLAFYHWVWPLTLFAGLAIGLAAVDALRGVAPAPARWVQPSLAGAALIAVVAPTVVNLRIDRRANELPAAYTRIERSVVDDVVDQVLADDDTVAGQIVLLSRNEPVFLGMSHALGFGLVERGVDLRYTTTYQYALHEDRVADRKTIEGSLIVVFDDESPQPAPAGGELVAEHVFPEIASETEAYESAVAAAEAADEMRFSPEQERALDRDLTAEDRMVIDEVLARVIDEPEEALRRQLTLYLLRRYPPLEPVFDPDDLATIADSEEFGTRFSVTALRVYALDREETLEVAYASELR
jgi:hypothetical protein